MICKKCGKEYSEESSYCQACGEEAQQPAGVKFCSKCGAKAGVDAVVCVKCGVPLPVSGRDWLTTLLLAAFLGYIGIHRFYTGQTGLGIGIIALAICTCGVGSFVWQVVDIIFIVTGSYRDIDGKPLVKKN